MKAKVRRTMEVVEEVDVDFPIYREDSDGVEDSRWFCFYRIKVGSIETILRRELRGKIIEYEMRHETFSMNNGLPYQYGKDKSSKEEWGKQVLGLKNYLLSFY